MAIALVAHPALGTLAGQLGAALPITGLYYPARSRPKDATLPFFADLTAMLEETGAGVCAFLSPYADLAKDIGICLEAGVDVLCAGPVPQLDLAVARKAHARTGTRLSMGGIHHAAPHFTKAYQQRCNPSFDQAVYLRLLAGAQGPGLLPTWWATCNQWALAVDLLGEAPIRLHLSANHQGRAYQVTLTAAAPSGAIIQLVIAPQRTLMELTLLGRGGLISASAAQGGVVLANTQTIQVAHDAVIPPELAWLQNFSERRDPPAMDGSLLKFGAITLRGLRRALRQRQPVLLAL